MVEGKRIKQKGENMQLHDPNTLKRIDDLVAAGIGRGITPGECSGGILVRAGVVLDGRIIPVFISKIAKQNLFFAIAIDDGRPFLEYGSVASATFVRMADRLRTNQGN